MLMLYSLFGSQSEILSAPLTFAVPNFVFVATTAHQVHRHLCKVDHLGSSSVIETSFSDIGDLLAEYIAPGYPSEYISELKPLFVGMQNAGLDGAWRVTVLLLSMTFTVDIFGRSAGSS
jgi:hypothetical protein